MKDKATGYKEKHEFALFVESLSSLVQHKRQNDIVLFLDEHLAHRMAHVLRLRANDTCVFFDRHMQVSVVIIELSKKQVQVCLHSIDKTIVLHPAISFLLPLLKRDDFEAALYSLTEVGVNTIQLVITQKSTHQWSNKDINRAQRIIISAAEQSKNFAYPELKEPIALEAALKQYNAAPVKIFFDPKGRHFFDVMKQLHTDNPKEILLLVGPEGDLHLEEKKIVQKNNFIFCALTATIVRAVQAATLGAGFVRSLLSH